MRAGTELRAVEVGTASELAPAVEVDTEAAAVAAPVRPVVDTHPAQEPDLDIAAAWPLPVAVS